MIIVFCCHFCDFGDFCKFAFFLENLHFLQICIFCKFAILQSLCFLPAGEVDPGGVGARVPREPRPLREVVDLF